MFVYVGSKSSCDRKSGRAPITKRDRVAKFHFITRGVQNGKDVNFEVS